LIIPEEKNKVSPMKITDHFKDSGKRKVSFELLPPLKGDNMQKIYNTLDPLMEFDPPYINVTYHREEVVFKKHENGLLERRIVRKRPGTVAISAAIKFRYGVDVVPHIICGGFSKEETENALIDLHFLGIHNVLALRGDTQKTERVFAPDPDGHSHASELVKQIMDMNAGRYLDEELENATPTQFNVGVAAYPEKHEEAPNMQIDLKFLKEKIDAGAEYIVTQMFFDNSKFYRFVDLCRDAGIMVPIIPGIKPLTSKSQIYTIPKAFSVDIPYELASEIEKCTDNSSAWQVGVEWSIAQSKDLFSHGVPVVHYYTMGRSDNIRKIVSEVV
jgi:methylenetetrahydrofolate reductase (NADPH)